MTGLILAGGQSRRMGRDKAFLKLGGRTAVERTLVVFRPLFDEIIIVSNAPEKFSLPGIRAVPDKIPGKGPLGGLYAGLRAADSARCFVAACDMPLIRRELAAYFSGITGCDAAVPSIRGKLQPLLALYSKSCLPAIRALLDAGDLRMESLLRAVNTRILSEEELLPFDPELLSFVNMNTPDDFRRAAKLCSAPER